MISVRLVPDGNSNGQSEKGPCCHGELEEVEKEIYDE